MRRTLYPVWLPILLLLLLAASQALAVEGKKAKAPAAPAAPVMPEGFDAAAFRQHFVAGLAGRPNAPQLSADDVRLEGAEKAADFAGTQIFAVRGVLAPAQGQAQPFLMFVSADGRYYVSDIVDMREGRSILKESRDRMRSADLKDLGHKVFTGKGSTPVVFVSDPFCPYCRQAFAFLMDRREAMAEFRLAHYPLPSHAGADMACAIMAWAEKKAPKRLEAMVAFGYGELPIPKPAERTPEQFHKARVEVAAAFLARFPELKALGKTGEAVAAALSKGEAVQSVQADMARAGSMGIDGTPIIFVDGVRVEGFDPERLEGLLK